MKLVRATSKERDKILCPEYRACVGAQTHSPLHKSGLESHTHTPSAQILASKFCFPPKGMGPLEELLISAVDREMTRNAQRIFSAKEEKDTQKILGTCQRTQEMIRGDLLVLNQKKVQQPNKKMTATDDKPPTNIRIHEDAITDNVIKSRSTTWG